MFAGGSAGWIEEGGLCEQDEWPLGMMTIRHGGFRGSDFLQRSAEVDGRPHAGRQGRSMESGRRGRSRL